MQIYYCGMSIVKWSFASNTNNNFELCIHKIYPVYVPAIPISNGR